MAVKLFSTCPPSSAVDRDLYPQRVAEVAQWSEAGGCEGILVYTDNSMVDPWLISQIIVQNTQALCPLVAVQPVYMHPYTVAKLVASFGYIYGRRLYLNMVAGGFKNDLIALNDTTAHDLRYQRLAEYAGIIKGLLRSNSPFSFEGKFFKVSNLKVSPPLASHLFPDIFMSGSSEAGHAVAKSLGATAIHYPAFAGNDTGPPVGDIDRGLRVGIITRESEEEAWEVAYQRFPEDRKGQITHQLALKVSDSSWHHQLSEMAQKTKEQRSPYWLTPFENYNTFCPYLVGDYQTVAQELRGYQASGYRSFILDVPRCPEDFAHTNRAFMLAQ